LKFKIVIITNGVLLNKANIENIIKNDVDGVSVSIDSFDDQINDLLRGRSETVKQNISELIKLGYPSEKIKLLMTVTRKNITSLAEILKFCNENNIGINVNPVEINSSESSYKDLDLRNCSESELSELKSHFNKWSENNKSKKSYAKAIFALLEGKKPERISCSMGSGSFVIYPSGEVYPCFYQLNNSVGNIFTENAVDVLSRTRKNKSYCNASCISLQCVCMTNTYNPGIIVRLFDRVKTQFEKNL
jgi:MoaA/NifB/PqqE/SkfB family radical SAM enzyme